MYFMARGVIRLSRDGEREHDAATFLAGDFFGEDALLSGEPYSATATAVTAAALYRLERVDLDVAIAHSPIIREALEKSGPWNLAITREDNRDSH